MMLMMMTINWIIYLALYYEENTSRALYKHIANCGKDWTNKCVFNCLLNDFSDDDCLMMTVKLF